MDNVTHALAGGLLAAATITYINTRIESRIDRASGATDATMQRTATVLGVVAA